MRVDGAGSRGRGRLLCARVDNRRLVGSLLTAAILLSLAGCATVPPHSQRRAPSIHATHPKRQQGVSLNTALLSAGMTMKAVRRLEPAPRKVVPMVSPTLTVEKWEYRDLASSVDLYFVNGLLQTWEVK